MSVEGQLTIALRRDAGGPGRAEISSTRPIGLARRFAGRDVGQVVRELPLLFSVCGIAQATASLAACAQATGLSEPPATRAARLMLIKAETLREHMLRVVHNLSRIDDEADEMPEPTRIMQIVPELRDALSPDEDLFALGAAPEIYAERVRMRIAVIEDLLQDLVFGEPPSEWLERAAPADVERWAEQGDTAAAWLVASVIRKGWADSGAAAAEFLPELPAAGLFERLTGAEGEAFAARPDWQGALYETTALARQSGQPLVAALLAARGAVLLTRLVARLVEMARLPDEMRALLEAADTAAPGDGALGAGNGLAQVEAARGRLVHAVTVEGEAVADYRILAPTEWNFHPQGGMARALAGLGGADDHGLRGQAALLIEAVDPCVGYELVVA